MFLALSGLVKGDPHGDVTELALIERALEDAGADPRRRAAALLNREMWERHRDRSDEALPLVREALALAEQARDPALLASALTRTADLEVLEGLAGDPVAHFERSLAAGAGLQLHSFDDSAPAMLAACLIRAGRVAEARRLLLDKRARVRAEGDESSLEMVRVFLAELEWLSGDWAQARAHAEEGLLVAEQAESRLLQGALSALIALVDGSRGLIEPARARAVEAIAICEDVGDRSYAAYARQFLGFIELSAGNAAAAREQFRSYPMTRGIEGTKRLAFVGDHIQALVLLDELDEAAALAKELARRGERLHRPTLSGAARVAWRWSSGHAGSRMPLLPPRSGPLTWPPASGFRSNAPAPCWSWATRNDARRSGERPARASARRAWRSKTSALGNGRRRRRAHWPVLADVSVRRD